jgi:hypothetical protein
VHWTTMGAAQLETVENDLPSPSLAGSGEPPLFPQVLRAEPKYSPGTEPHLSTSSSATLHSFRSSRAMAFQDTHASRKEIIAVGLQAARAVVLIKKAVSGNGLKDPERNELAVVRETVTVALEATRPTASTTIGSQLDYRSLATVVEMTIQAAEGDVSQEISKETIEEGRLTASLSARLSDLDAIIAGKLPTDEAALLGFMRDLVTLSRRRAAGPGETLVRAQPHSTPSGSEQAR